MDNTMRSVMSSADRVIVAELGNLSSQRIALDALQRKELDQFKGIVVGTSPHTSEEILMQAAKIGARLVLVSQLRDEVETRYNDLVQAWARKHTDQCKKDGVES